MRLRIWLPALVLMIGIGARRRRLRQRRWVLTGLFAAGLRQVRVRCCLFTLFLDLGIAFPRFLSQAQIGSPRRGTVSRR